MDNAVRGFCPICHEIIECESVEPEHPDDPFLEISDHFKLKEHKVDGSGSEFCSGTGQQPTALEDNDEGPDMYDGPEEDESDDRADMYGILPL